MIRRFSVLALLALLAVPTALEAQGEQGTVVLSYSQCSYGQMNRIAQIADSVMVPIAQELVDEGLLTNYGALFHDVGDEWNVVFVYAAQDKPTFFAAWEEYNRRLNDRHPALVSFFTEHCRAHKENMYIQGPFTQARPPGR